MYKKLFTLVLLTTAAAASATAQDAPAPSADKTPPGASLTPPLPPRKSSPS